MIRYSFAVALLNVIPVIAFGQTLTAKPVTIKDKNLTVADAIKKLAKQSGIELADNRLMANKSRIQLDHERSSFWRVADDIARQADCRISLYQPGAAIALVDGKPSPVLSSHNGIFRGTVQRVALTKDFANGFHNCRISLQFAWEPWFKPYFLEVKDYQAVFGGARGFKQIEKSGRKGRIGVHNRHVVLADDLLLPGPKRDATTISTLKGAIAVIGPAAMETIMFKDLKTAAEGIPQTQKIGKVTKARLVRLRMVSKKLWLAIVELNYPDDGPMFDTGDNWQSNDKIWLQDVNNKKRRIAPRNYSIGARDKNHVLIEYMFQATKEVPLGKPSDWHLSYTAPTRIVEMTVPFEFKNVPLP